MLFAALIEKLRVWKRERDTFQALQRLQMRDLEDIGLAGTDIASVARTAARA